MIIRWLMLFVLFCLFWGPALRLSAQNFRVLHSFTATAGNTPTNSDGANPQTGLTLSGNTLFGTAAHGGSGPPPSSSFPFASGTIFKLNTDGSGFRVLKALAASEGMYPGSTLSLSGGTLFGTTTTDGGPGYGGKLFKLGTNGSGFTILHDFSINPDGNTPSGSLVLAGGALWGTTEVGGSDGFGSIYTIRTNGAGYSIIRNAKSRDGVNPAGLLFPGGKWGGTLFVSTHRGDSGSGSVFSIRTNGSSYSNLYNFSRTGPFPDYTNSDGASVAGSLILSGTTLYGMTSLGGRWGKGSIFSININGSGFTNLHSFSGGSNGAFPGAGLVLSGRTLYGTTSGGLGDLAPDYGTVFAIRTNGNGFTNLHVFSPTAKGTNWDGANPGAELVYSGGRLFGTAANGGNAGNGTIFCLDLRPTLSITNIGSRLVFIWGNADFFLQCAADRFGIYTNIPGASSPYTNFGGSGRVFFRLAGD